MRDTRKVRFGLIAVLVALAAAACTSGGSTASNTNTNTNTPQTLTWWHNGTAAPLLGIWQQVANDYHAAHPNVTIKVDPIQNEQFLTKVPLALQSSSPPDIYQQWGYGREATEAKSGKLGDLTANVSSWLDQFGPIVNGWQVNGKQLGVPYDLHVVGFWYRKDLFATAGITSPPTTMDDLNSDVSKLKAANIVPIASGSKDRWPDAFYWGYFAVRECSVDTMKRAASALKLDDPCWVKAGQDVQKFLATQPFQNGFLGTPAQQGAGSSAGMVANGKAAMELQGDWEPATMASLTSDPNFMSKMGWFPFPSVPGGKGDPRVALGGGDGFTCTTTAPPACADFLKYIDSTPVQQKLASQGTLLPVNPAAASAITDPTVKQVYQYLHSRQYIQAYFDTALPFTPGQALDDAVANYFANQGTPQSIVSSVTNAIAGDK
jgi:raffinose/stachyose/melibiose transport system substrate-binding protein